MTVEPMAVNILLVDDEPKNLIALESVLDSRDLNLVRAGSGEEALRHVLNQDFAVILLDVQMADMDGFETAALIRGRESSRDVPIIFLTAASRSETFVARGYSVGAVDYIVKPFDPEILRSKVAVFVELFKRTYQVKRQAAQLAETTDFLNSVLESSTEYAIVALDLDGRIQAWNAGARQIYGYTSEEVVGRGELRLLHTPEDVANGEVDRLVDAACRSGKAERVCQHVRKDGSRFSASLTIDCRVDAEGATVGYVSISQDITELERAERERAQLIVEQAARAEAEAARDRLQQVVDVLPEAIVIADTRGLFFLSNAAALEILGEVPPLELAEYDRLGVVHLDGTPYRPEELPLARAVLHGEVVRGEQLIIPNATTGRQTPVLVNAAPLRDTQGVIVGGVATFQDISSIKELERQKEAFLAAASHDLKNPLTAIKARAQILQRRASRLAIPETLQLAEGLHGIDQTATRLTAMINELLDVTRLQMGRPLGLDRQSTDLVALAEQVAADHRPATERHEIRVVGNGGVVGPWDRARLERALTNLVTNAIKYSPEGGCVTLEVLKDRVDAEEWAVLHVRDQGIGIPADELPRVFDRFYRASNVDGTIEGTGIGLSGARQIVELHGGGLSVESREHVGTTFTIRLPLHER